MPTSNEKPNKETTAYTIRLQPETAKAFDKLRNGRTIKDVGEEAIRDWIERQNDPLTQGVSADTARELQESLQENLVSAVTEHLRSKPEWAEAAINAASLMDPVVSVYIQRVHHFHSEKKTLSENFVPWLIERILFYARQSRDVYLVVESGTTLKATLDEIGPQFHRKQEFAELRAEQIQIVTNNFPGAESYEAYASKTKVGERLLEAVVPCHLVPGRALREYSAVVGARAEAYLRACCPTEQRLRDAVYLGLVVGNWVMLEGRPARPVPLARGEGHKSFKEVVLETCDEVFVLTPLCKIFHSNPEKSPTESLSEFNHDFFEGAVAPTEKGEYERVSVSDGQLEKNSVKLVTTWRSVPMSIVATHSVGVIASLYVAPKEDYSIYVDKPIAAIPHFFYKHDTHSDRTFEDQLRAELPHKRTRAPDFRAKYFHIAQK